MTRPLSIGTLHGSDLRLHWSWPLLPVATAVYSLAVFPWREAILHVLLLLAAYIASWRTRAFSFWPRRRFGLGTRDVTLYPFWGVARLTRLSDRPWQENYIAATGPVVLGLIATALAGVLTRPDTASRFPTPSRNHLVRAFLAQLFWANIFLVGLHLLPVLPLDGGRILRASLAMTGSRLGRPSSPRGSVRSAPASCFSSRSSGCSRRSSA